METRSLRLALLLSLSTPLVAGAATLTVNSVADNTIQGDGLVTLREAIVAAEVDGSTDLGQNGAGSDVIVVTVDGTIAPLTRLPAITTPVTVIGNGVDALTISGASLGGTSQRRIFDVRGGALSLIALTVTAGDVVGFGGGSCQQRSGCGGGSAALGGLVSVDPGRLAISQARLSTGSATGGNGGSRTLAAGTAGGGGGAGLGGPGATPATDSTVTGGTGGSATPGGPTTAPGGNGVEGAGGGGGTSGTNLSAANGGSGGFGAGGGGGGYAFGMVPSALAGAGGYGGGGGGRGAGATGDGPGGAAGPFGGNGGPSSGSGNVGGGGGGGAGLGGCVFARNAQVEIADTEFIDCRALGGNGGVNGGTNPGESGQGKGGAVFLDATVQNAILANVRFSGSVASGSSGNGFTPGAPSDTVDVFGTARTALFANGFE